MVLIDELRNKLSEAFCLRDYKIDESIHGAIASIITYGALCEASEKQIESAIGVFVS